MAVTLGTLAGTSYNFNLPVQASVLEGKCQVAAELRHPAELQRWLLNDSILEDTDLLASLCSQASSQTLSVMCIFLPRTFQVKVKVIKFSPGAQAQSAAEVFVTISPAMTIDAAKFEALSEASASMGPGAADLCAAARLIKGGLYLEDEQTVEHYHIDPESTLHLIVPRGRSGNHGLPRRETVDEQHIRPAQSAHAHNHTEIPKELLSPGIEDSSSKFTTMGVHRLRPRRSASMPVQKPSSRRGGARAGDEELAHIGCKDKVQMADTNYKKRSMPSDAGLSCDISTDVPGKDSDEHRISPDSSADLNATSAARLVQKPRQPRTTPARPSRARQSSRCDTQRRTQRRSSSVRAGSIDRWHFAARRC